MIHHVKRATRHLIFWTLLITAISLTAIRLLLIGVDRYKANLEAKISAAIGTQVTLSSLGANMRGVTPELVLKNIDILPATKSQAKGIHIKEVRWGLDLGQYMLHRDLLSSSAVTLVGADLSAYRANDGRFVVDGLKANSGQPLWLFQGQYTLLNSHIIWQDQLKAGKPVVFDKVNLAVFNQGDQHRVNAIINLPQTHSGDLKMVADVNGSLEHPEALTGTVFFEGNHVKLPALAVSYLPANIRAIAGSANIKMWGRLQSEQRLALTGTAQLKDTVLVRDGFGKLAIKYLDTEFNANIDAKAWRVDFAKFALHSATNASHQGERWPNAVFSIGSEQALTTTTESLKVFAKTINLAEVSQICGFFAPLTVSQAQDLKLANVQGELQDFQLYTEPLKHRFALAGQFTAFSIQPLANRPGIDHLSGRFKASETAGVVAVNSKAVHLDYNKLFAKPVLLDALKGTLNWQQSEDAVTLQADNIELNTPAFTSAMRTQVIMPKSQAKPFVDVQMTFKSDDISKLSAYLPTRVMKDSLNLWLSNAFKAGKLNHGELLLYGNVDDFPFINGAGVFQAALELDKTQLKFHPDWQSISAIKGKVSFDKNVIKGQFDGGQMAKAGINATEMLISGLGSNQAQLNIKSTGTGEINNVLQILQQSPISSRVNPVISNTTLVGDTQVSLDLTVPLVPGKQILVDAGAGLTDAKLTINHLKLPITHINGAIKFNPEGVFAKDLQASALGFPIKVNANMLDKKTQITVNGKVGVQELAKFTQWSQLLQAQGETAYQVEILMPPLSDNDTAVLATLSSDLKGIEFALPTGSSKTKFQSKPLEISVAIADKQQELPIKVNYNNDLKAALKLALPEQTISSGHILLGKGNAEFSRTPGLTLEINRTPISLQDYLALAQDHSAASDSINIKDVSIRSESALWGAHPLGKLNLTLKRNPTFWSGAIHSSFAKGVFDIPLDFSKPAPAVLSMDMLNLSAFKEFNGSIKATLPTNLNILPNIRSKQTLWRSVDLGQLILETEKTPLGIKIKRLNLEGENESLEATGAWDNTRLSSVTDLRGHIVMKRADELFSKLNITKDFTQTSGKINFQLNWHAVPWQLALSDLRGHMDVKLDRGRILSIEPGIGRILGILAVEQWIKRLQLDFSDIFSEGLTYNSIKGDFNLARGKASTQNLFIDAVPAKITITGDTDYVNQRVDHLVNVVPKSLDAVPIAGTIMSKITDFIGKTITGKNQEGFFLGKQYTVKGDWNHAEIKPLHKNDGILQKTWSNITGAQ